MLYFSEYDTGFMYRGCYYLSSCPFSTGRLIWYFTATIRARITLPAVTICVENVPDAQGITGEIDESTEDAGDGVDVFPEDKGYLVDENVANDSPDGTGGHTHDDGDPHGESGKQAFFDTYHGE